MVSRRMIFLPVGEGIPHVVSNVTDLLSKDGFNLEISHWGWEQHMDVNVGSGILLVEENGYVGMLFFIPNANVLSNVRRNFSNRTTTSVQIRTVIILMKKVMFGYEKNDTNEVVQIDLKWGQEATLFVLILFFDLPGLKMNHPSRTESYLIYKMHVMVTVNRSCGNWYY